MLLAFHEYLRPDTDASGLPPEIVDLIRSPPLPSKWIPTVHATAVELMVLDQTGDDAAFLALGLELNEKYLGSRLYRAAVSVLSPAMLLRGAASRWAHFHRGSKLNTVRVEPTRAVVRLGFPDHLFPPIVAMEKAHSFRVAMQLAGAQQLTIDVDTEDPREALYHVAWERA